MKRRFVKRRGLKRPTNHWRNHSRLNDQFAGDLGPSGLIQVWPSLFTYIAHIHMCGTHWSGQQIVILRFFISVFFTHIAFLTMNSLWTVILVLSTPFSIITGPKNEPKTGWFKIYFIKCWFLHCKLGRTGKLHNLDEVDM